eukprot:5490355-Pleurochrysis_carterae.AAC.1
MPCRPWFCASGSLCASGPPCTSGRGPTYRSTSRSAPDAVFWGQLVSHVLPCRGQRKRARRWDWTPIRGAYFALLRH